MIRLLGIAAISFIVLSYGQAMAQQYPQPYQQQMPQPQQLSDNMNQAYAPQQYYAVPTQPQYQAVPQQPAPAADHSGEYGSSVMTDIRQMNF